MDMEKDMENIEKLDLKMVISILWGRRKLFAKGCLCAFVLACIWILPQPRYYTATVSLAPESGAGEMGGSLGSIASSFGFDLGGANTGDAIYPMLYPEVLGSSDFLVTLFDIPVKDSEGSVNTDYYSYLTKHQKKFIWTMPFYWCKKKLTDLFADADAKGKGGQGKVDPFRLTERQDQVVNSMRGKIQCTYDLKTEIITLTVTDQDPLISATIADSVRVRLQKYITDYRTSKARIDADYYKQLTDEAEADYDKSVKAYSDYCDAHQNILLQRYASERDKLENDMQNKLNTYTAFNTQYQAAVAKIQQRTPAFTIIQGVTVPLMPAGPKRIIFVAAMMILTCMGLSVYVLRRYIF